MTTDTIIEILKSKSMSFTPKEIQEIKELMDKELEKDPSEMDTELIDLCADILVKAQKAAAEASKKTGRKKLRKVLPIAAVIAVIFAIVIPVSAAFINSEVSDKIVRFCSDCFNIDLRKGSTNANHYSDNNDDLIQELQNRGFNNIILPEDLLSYIYSEDIAIQKSEYITMAVISIQDLNSEIKGNVAITQYDEMTESMAGVGNIASMYNHIEQLSVNGIDILVFGDDNNAYIKYLDNNTEYSITLSKCDFDIAVKIANSLK